MAKKKITRKELLKEPDEFLTLSARTAHFFSTHRKQMNYVGIGLAAVILIYLGASTYLKRVNQKGQDAYNEAYYVLTKNLNADSDAKRLRESEILFSKLQERYGLSKAARLALAQLAYLKFREKDYDGAMALYQSFLERVSEDSAFRSLADLALAACYEQKGDLKKAIEVLRPMVENSKGPFREPAMLNLARVYRLNRQVRKSEEILEQFVKEYADSPFLPLAKASL